MSFLPPNLQRQSIEGNTEYLPVSWPHPFFIHHRTLDGTDVVAFMLLSYTSTRKPEDIVTQTPRQPFYSPFSGTTRVSGSQKRTSGFYGEGNINRGRHTDHRLCATPSGLTSAHLHHPPIFYRPDSLPAAQATVSKHWRQLVHSDKGEDTRVLLKCYLHRLCTTV